MDVECWTSDACQSRRGFTLIELLVVIGIVSMLMAILLPVLSMARRTANTIKCLSNLRQVAQGMHLYAADNDDFVPGSPNTSGLFLFDAVDPPYSDANCPDVSQIWDWHAPVGASLGIDFNTGPTMQDRRERFYRLNSQPVFTCPANQMISTAFTGNGGPDFGAHPTPSYNAAAAFMYKHNPDENSGYLWRRRLGYTQFNPPYGYSPKLTSMGRTNLKVFVACGARYSDNTQPPNTNFRYATTSGGAYADHGAHSRFGKSWNRTTVATTAPVTGLDARVYGFRHGRVTRGGAVGEYRFTAAFYDGHAETLDELTGGNPTFWLPKGTRLELSELYDDVRNTYYPGMTAGDVVTIGE